jgi:hypothetical protein
LGGDGDDDAEIPHVDQLGPQQKHPVEEEDRIGACLDLPRVDEQVVAFVVDPRTVEPAAGVSELTEQLDQKSLVVERVLVTTPRRLVPLPVALDPRAAETASIASTMAATASPRPSPAPTLTARV